MERRINAGYEIVQSIQVGKAEFVLGMHRTAPNQFVTWECSNGTSYDCGHYTNSFLEAMRDLCERAIQEVDYLEQRQGHFRERGKTTKGKNQDMER